MKYDRIIKGRFLDRPNRFVAHVDIGGETLPCHVKNTGRCRELLIPGVRVWLTKSGNPKRKTAYDLIAVEKGARLINLDAQAPNAVFAQWAQAGHFIPGLDSLKAEQTFGDSRFDFSWTAGKRRGFVEVKGVTLEEDGTVYFPDAPTQRGVKNLRELIACREAGYEAAVCFVLQMAGMDVFSPNDATHPEFGAALREAARAGVKVLAVECGVTPRSLVMTRPVSVALQGRRKDSAPGGTL